MPKRVVLLKLSGEIFLKNGMLDGTFAHAIAKQIKELADEYTFGIVIGGGNFFRGAKHAKKLNVTPAVCHQVGMLATMMNGLLLQDIMRQHDIANKLFSALSCESIANTLRQESLDEAITNNTCLIFTAGTGAPFFTTDTAAIVRALQIKADEVWKATTVDGIYAEDPKYNPKAQRYAHVTYHQALQEGLAIMDATALALAREHALCVRVFNLFAPHALERAAHDPTFSSRISL